MESINKFKMWTIIFLCMFVFVIAAIYTNTKDVSEHKNQQVQKLREEKFSEQVADENSAVASDNTQLQELTMKVNELNQRLNDMSTTATGRKMNCNIQGVLDENNNIEQLTQDAALQEAENSGKELVLTCSF